MGDDKRSEPRILEWKAEKPLLPIVDANLSTFLLEKMALQGNKTAVVDAVSGKERTYNYYCENVPRVAGGLASGGVAEGDVVLLLSPSHVDFPLIMLAVLHMGAVCLPVSLNVTPEELAWAVGMSGARWAVVNGAKAEETVKAAQELLPKDTLRRVWCMTHSLAHLEANPVPPRRLDGEASRTTMATIFMSSGTTGKPKGVMLSHTSLIVPHVRSRYMMSLIEGGESMTQEVFRSLLIIMPLYHVYGSVLMLSNFAFGGTTVLLPQFTPKKFLETIEKFKVTMCPIVPHIANFLKETPLLQQYDLSSILSLNSSAAPISLSTVNAVFEKTGKMVASVYGMTEVGPITTNGPAHGFKPDAVGRVLPYLQVKVVDLESGNVLAEGEEGEVCVKGPSIMLGYINDSDATSAAIDADGWFHTGDLGYYDDEDFLHLTDRIREVIKVKGIQVSPREIEEVLQQAEGVSESAVVGVPHPRTGEAPRAYVVPSATARLSPEYLQQFVAERVAAHKQLVGGVEVVEYLPRNPTGKVLKRKLRERYLASLSKL